MYIFVLSFLLCKNLRTELTTLDFNLFDAVEGVKNNLDILK